LITYSATLDVSDELAWYVSGLLLAERQRRGTPRGSRKPGCFRQAVPGLRWFRDRTAIETLGRDNRISRATACRYAGEVTGVLAAEAPELPEALGRAMAEGAAFVIPGGKVIASDRCRTKTQSVKGEAIDLWYSGKAHSTAATSRPSPCPAGSRSGSRTQSPARSPTSPPPGPPHSPPSTAHLITDS
jgi:hypothetical protein